MPEAQQSTFERHEALRRRFTHGPPLTDSLRATRGGVRAICLEAARLLTDALPPGREASLVLTKLEEAMFWSLAALDRHPGGSDE